MIGRNHTCTNKNETNATNKTPKPAQKKTETNNKPPATIKKKNPNSETVNYANKSESWHNLTSISNISRRSCRGLMRHRIRTKLDMRGMRMKGIRNTMISMKTVKLMSINVRCRRWQIN